MGSGKSASKSAGYAINLIESFYKAGFDDKDAVQSVGQLLSLRESEEFSAVDVTVIDTAEGSADFIKIGGRESFIVHKGGVEMIECGSLPLGILAEETEALVEKRRLSSGSFIVMASDGVLDTLGRQTLSEMLSETRITNPDTLAAAIMAETERLNANDDASVIVTKIFSRKD
jgi:stage II sporulation protein E